MADIHIEFPEPCHEDWEAMHPLGRARHCDRCDKPVHDLIQHTPEEAEALLRGAAGPACLRAHIGADGQVLTRPSRFGKRLTAAVAAPALFIALAAGGAAADPATGAISGTLKVAHATPVTVTAVAAGVRRSVEAGANGAYRLDRLPPGAYRLEFAIRNAVWWAVDRVAVRANYVTVRRGDMPPPVAPRLVEVPPPIVTGGIPVMGAPPPAPPSPAPAAAATVTGDVAIVTAGRVAPPAR